MTGDAARGRRPGGDASPIERPSVRLPPRPTIYEINTAVWLERLGRDRGRPLALDEVPAPSGTRSPRCRSTRCG